MFNFVRLVLVVFVLAGLCVAVCAESKTFEINDEKCIYSFAQGMTPILTVPDGSTLVIKTKDCFANQLLKPDDKIDTVDWNQVNPATGPVFIEGAEPGDTLEIKIEKIEVGSQGVMMVDKTFGVLKDRFDGMYFKIFPIKDGKFIFDEKLSIPIRPMIGVIGVAPKSGSFNTGTPNSHGGNMDTNLIIAGTTLYLPVSEKGAMLAVGDIHAVMGDGEICGTGVETPANVTLTVNVRKDIKNLNNPVLDNGKNIMVIASAQTLDEAAVIATSNMADILAAKLPLDMERINYLMSAAGNLEISQVVDPLMTVRFSMAKDILAAYGFKF